MAGKNKMAREWARLRMLCCSGADAITIAPDASAVVRQLVPNGSLGLFLSTPGGDMRARFHDNCPSDVEELCTNWSYLDLFTAPDEPTLRSLYLDANGPKVGRLLNPSPDYYHTNTYQLLVRGSGQHHSLDARLELDGQLAGSICLFREEGVGFDADDVADMGRIAQYFEHALRARRPAWDEADRAVEREEMVVANTRGDVLFASPGAQALLREIPLVRGEWPDRNRLPPLCLRLIDVLRDDARYPGQLPSQTLSLPGGALEVRAQWLGLPADHSAEAARALAAEGMVGIHLTRLSPLSLRVWRNLRDAGLSPTQMEVAFWMAVGGSREAARERLSISEAVLRDSVKAVYERLGCASQAELVASLRAVRH